MLTAITQGGGRMAKKKQDAPEQPATEETGLVEQLRQAIRNSGESLNHLGQRSGVSRDRLSRFLRGERDLTLTAAEKLCFALGLRLAGGDGGSIEPAKGKGKK
jgi:transcriptional regulator with XRE-family HTH domain